MQIFPTLGKLSTLKQILNPIDTISRKKTRLRLALISDLDLLEKCQLTRSGFPIEGIRRRGGCCYCCYCCTFFFFTVLKSLLITKKELGKFGNDSRHVE